MKTVPCWHLGNAEFGADSKFFLPGITALPPELCTVKGLPIDASRLGVLREMVATFAVVWFEWDIPAAIVARFARAMPCKQRNSLMRPGRGAICRQLRKLAPRSRAADIRIGID